MAYDTPIKKKSQFKPFERYIPNVILSVGYAHTRTAAGSARSRTASPCLKWLPVGCAHTHTASPCLKWLRTRIGRSGA